MTMRSAHATVLLVAILTPTAEAAIVPLYQSGTENGTFEMLEGESRQTHLQVLNDLTITELGVIADPQFQNQKLIWRIYSSDSAGTFGSQLFSAVVPTDDVDLTEIASEESFHLDAGAYYILDLRTESGILVMQRFDEDEQGLPFTTIDGNFNVLNGGANGAFSNTILPAFRVSAEVDEAAVPEPASLAIWSLGAMGCAIAAIRRQRITESVRR